MRTLVTGLGGFTGRYVQAELVSHGHEVIGLQSDLTDMAALDAEMRAAQPDWVVHLAGIAFVGHGEVSDFYRVNLLGTRNLLQALADCGKRPACVLLASSANVYGNSTEGVLTEASPPNPANDYAVSKLSMEYMARLWLHELPIVIVRPFNYTGPGQSLKFVIPKLVDHYARCASVVELGNLHVEREFNDVRLVSAAYKMLLEHGRPGEVYNVCSGRPYTLSYVMELLSELSGHRLQPIVNPAFVRAHEVRRLCGDPGKLQRICTDAGVVLPSYSLRDTLAWMLTHAQRI